MHSDDRAWRNLSGCIQGLLDPVLRGRLLVHRTPHAAAGCWTRRYWITLDSEILWDFPGPFEKLIDGWTYPANYPGLLLNGRWGSEDPTFDLLGRYVDTPIDDLLRPTDGDYFGLTNMFRAADRRLGFLRLFWWAIADLDADDATRRVLGTRFADRRSRFSSTKT